MGTKAKNKVAKPKGAARSAVGAKTKTASKSADRKPKAASKGRTRGESKKSADAAASAEGSTRRLGIRGAAPWAARHAAKHAAEARARAAEPPPPGSARATIRVPTGAEEIKARVADLHNALNEIRALRKNLARGFYDIGIVLRDIQARKLYEARGFGTFEAFVEREVDLGKSASLSLIRVVEVFQREAALECGMDRTLRALAVLDGPDSAQPQDQPANAGAGSRPPLPLRPPTASKK